MGPCRLPPCLNNWKPTLDTEPEPYLSVRFVTNVRMRSMLIYVTRPTLVLTLPFLIKRAHMLLLAHHFQVQHIREQHIALYGSAKLCS